MAKYDPQVQSLLGGMNTRQNEAGLPLGQHSLMTNTRLNEGIASRRQGMKRLTALSATGQALLFAPDEASAEDAYVTIPLNVDVHTLPPQFTIDIMVNPDESAGTGDTQQILGFSEGTSPFSLFWTEDAQVKFIFVDEDATSFTLTSASAFSVSSPDTVLPIRIVRDGANLTMYVAETIEASTDTLTATAWSATPTGDLLIGSDGHGTDNEFSFSGYVDDFLIWHIVLTDNDRCYREWHDPRHPGLVAHYRCEQDASDTTLLVDESRFGNHGGLTGSVSFSTGLSTPIEPVIGLRDYQHSNGSRRVLIAAGTTLYYSRVL